MKISSIQRFLNHQISRRELRRLHEDVNHYGDEIMTAIERDWDEYDLVEDREWTKRHWDHLQERLGISQKKKNSKVFLLHWTARIAATLLVVASVWFALHNNTGVPSDAAPSLITEVNDTDKPALIVLRDGTKVTLTAHSALSYYDNFNKRYRVVHLDGEAYFETDGENMRPFVVISENITSICRGEEFSISAFKERDEINVTLASGQIEISRNDRLNSENNKVAVKSCQKYSFSKSTNEYLIGQISDCEYHDKARSMRTSASTNTVML